MRAAVLTAYNAPLQISEIPDPAPGPGEVLVRVAASGVNPLDTKIRRGAAAHAKMAPPAVLGIDMAGTVEAVGAEVDHFGVGDQVFGMTGGVGGVAGSLAELATVDARLIAHKPTALSMEQAAAIPLGFITSWEGLVDRAGVAAGHQVLIHGGAGGVGYLAVQLALARGAQVFATGGPASQEVIRRVGATPIDYTASTVDDYVDEHTGGEGFDIVVDNVGGATLDASFTAVKRYTGHVVSALGWGTHSLAPLSFRGATYSGVFTLLPLLTGEGREHHGHIVAQAAALADARRLVPRLHSATFALGEVNDAYQVVENGSATGKVVVQPHA
ncbi:zinc-dependent alcohol dehydrogenase family protein [Mycolicibacterium fluoranthenivorans]|uniref:NADPH:quinone reductase-like Zn-dependent oxidoreductase n=1 Tax=Mycolicibacterium fluoranthenivorans TaxID=258505 RepID=A0A7X5U028_9MYCO|nr:zinc-dependent alcohol dehydrogenase family protein [Mycolicibacterium fluoranthenivorans]MCV7357979.1 zinc-dependent alcohol dehydrogenase family protein [Mycolicibacterium fluoranthenivorans]NIH95902.1 NADPH:quinone reductase-like Zn-dependent oxidoreductase [Mycolicibacterium fluoranthenivorans]